MTAGNEIRPSRQQGESWSVERITNDKASQGHRLHTIQEDVKLSSKPARESGKGYSDEDAVFDLDTIFKDGKVSRRCKETSRDATNLRRMRVEDQASEEEKQGKQSKRKHKVSPLLPVSRPRRFEDGLPVYKSFEDFSDLSHGRIPPRNGRANGKCPFDCWCCF